MRCLFHRIKRFKVSFREIHALIPFGDFFKIMNWNDTAYPQRFLITLNILPIGRMPVMARKGTSDLSTLKTTFLQQYHLPHKKLSDIPTILDLGCNVGYTILHFSYQYPKAQIIGVEMDYDNFKLAQKNTRNVKNVCLLNKAISISDGVVSYNKNASEDAYQISLKSPTIFGEEIKVQSVTITSLIQQLNLGWIDYVKMDIEGEEVRVFNKQLSDLSWLNMVGMLNVEVHTNTEDLKRIILTLEDHNFDVWKDDHHWSCIKATKV